MSTEVQAYINELREQLLALSDRAAGLAAENSELKQHITLLESAQTSQEVKDQ